MTPTPRPMWARTLTEAGMTTVVLASLVLFIIFLNGVLAFHPAAMLILGMLLTLAIVILREYWHAWRTR